VTDAGKLAFDASKLEIVQLTETIKQARATLLRYGAPTEVVVLHRKIDIKHELTEYCLCSPVFIAQNEWRPSMYFAHQVLYPTMH